MKDIFTWVCICLVCCFFTFSITSAYYKACQNKIDCERLSNLEILRITSQLKEDMNSRE